MPFYHKPREFTPLLIAAEKKSKKEGLHHAVFTSRFDRYVGDWKKDLKEDFWNHTTRIRNIKTQLVVELDLRNGSPVPYSSFTGKGRFLTINGKLYEGDWYKGFRHGFGLLSKRQPNGTFKLIYRGEWVRGKPEGAGWMYYENGDVFLGFWKKGMKHGYGSLWYADKTFYAGYFNKDMREGLGMHVLQNGNRYEGHWEKDKKSGIGRFYHVHTGQLQEGCWVDDVCVKSKMTDIVLRQACHMPTPYPIPPHNLKFVRSILEYNEFWTKQKVGAIDKNLKFCIDQM